MITLLQFVTTLAVATGKQAQMVTTRSAAAHRRASQQLPEELWVEVLSRLDGPKEIGRALCTTKLFSTASEHVWRGACSRRWPGWAALALSAETKWKRQYEILELREREEDAVPQLAAIASTQKVVTARHRLVLTEWLAEVRAVASALCCKCQLKTGQHAYRRSACLQVSWDWDLESTMVFKAVSYLDHYLSRRPVDALSRYVVAQSTVADLPAITCA